MQKFSFTSSRLISVPYAGNTVIHLDQALARMREYERMKTEAESNTNARCTCRIMEDENGAAAESVKGVLLNSGKVILYSSMYKN